MNIRSLDDLFFHELQQLYFAEKLVSEAGPKLATRGAKPEDSPVQVQTRIQRLEQIFVHMDRRPTATACKAIEGILAETDTLLTTIEDVDARDAAKTAAGHTILRYLLARYSVLVLWAHQLGKSTAERLLLATLDAENLLNKGEARASTIGGRLTALFDRKG